MRSFPIIGVLLFLAAAVVSSAPLHSGDGSSDPRDCGREDYYCQQPDYQMIYNISSGFDAEMADDIPEEHANRYLEGIAIWVGEWYSMGGPTWRDPLGVRLNLYNGTCPPEMEPFHTVEVAWADADKVLVLDDGGKTVYEVSIWFPDPIWIDTHTSIGATALIDWGHDEPFTGIVATPMYTSYGACVMYLDAEWWGYYRWTAIDFYHGIPQDMAYCIRGYPTSVEGVESAMAASVSAAPNPFHHETTLRFFVPGGGPTRATLHDIRGRQVRVLLDAWQGAGEQTVVWRGHDEMGRRLPAGVYVVRLEIGGRASSQRLVLLE